MERHLLKQKGVSRNALSRFLGVSTRQVDHLVSDPKHYLACLASTHPAWAVWLARWLGVEVPPVELPRLSGKKPLPLRSQSGMAREVVYVGQDVPDGVVVFAGGGWWVVEPPTVPSPPGAYFFSFLQPPLHVPMEIRRHHAQPVAKVLAQLEEPPLILEV